RVGGANYQVPVEVPQRRARTLAIRWLVTYARDRREKGMPDKLANEILDALNEQGGAYKRKDDIYRMAQANKAFAHYRWEGSNDDSDSDQGRTRARPQHRDHGPHRRGQDDDDRADPLLHRSHAQDGRGARGRGDDGLDGAGAGARHHDHVRRHDGVLARPP